MLGGADNPNGELPSYITGANSIVGMQDATVPGRLTVQVAVNGTEHPVAAKNGNRAADSHENVSFC
ncbi:TPA: hypothetical protein J5G33_004943 [Escherichia coli]|nr:hypothetical protein [Escherichia coli]